MHTTYTYTYTYIEIRIIESEEQTLDLVVLECFKIKTKEMSLRFELIVLKKPKNHQDGKTIVTCEITRSTEGEK